ncbi:hypothetical protein ACQY0O_005460 [Thecaphora frezii]
MAEQGAASRGDKPQQAEAGDKRKADQQSDAEATATDHPTPPEKQQRTEKDPSSTSPAPSKPSQADGQLAVDAPELDQQQKRDDGKLKGDDTEIHKADSGHKIEVRWHINETGFIYYFYRPKVHPAKEATGGAVSKLDDVQNSFMLLIPRRSESKTAPAPPKAEKTAAGGEGKGDSDGKDKHEPPNPTGYRLIALGRKRLPDVELALSHGQEPRGIGGRDSEATWATISNVGTNIQELMDGMKENCYSTKTRGERVQPSARPAGRGHYVLSVKQSDPPTNREVRLTYHVSHPSADEFGDVQKEIGIHPSSSLLLQMRNPTMPPTGPDAPMAGLPAEQRAKLTKEELERNFGGDLDSGGNRYARPEDPKLLDREGVELLVIKRRNQEEEGLKGVGDGQAGALEDIAKRDAERIEDDEMLNELRLSTEDTEVEALSGDWI